MHAVSINTQVHNNAPSIKQLRTVLSKAASFTIMLVLILPLTLYSLNMALASLLHN